MEVRVSSTSRIDERLRLARLGQGLSQAALADQAHVTRQTISGIESGRWSPSLDVAFAIAATLGSTVEELFGAAPRFAPVQSRLVVGGREPARLLISAISGEQVAFPLEGDHVLVPGFRPALAEVPGDGPGGAGTYVEASRFVAPAPALVVAGCDPALALLAGPWSGTAPRWAWCGGTAAIQQGSSCWTPVRPTSVPSIAAATRRRDGRPPTRSSVSRPGGRAWW